MRPDLLLNSSAQKATYAAASVLAACALSLTSCIDDNFDLSDIDSTVRVSVNDLTLPVNIDEIKLESVIDIKDDGILQVLDGEYAILRTGEFSSSALKIDPIVINPPTSNPSVTTFLPEIPVLPTQKRVAPESVTFSLSTSDTSPINYTYDGVSKDIVSIDRLGASWSINYDVTLSTSEGATTRFTLDHIIFQLPKGLTGKPSMGSYDIETGRLTIDNYVVANGKLNFVMGVTSIDATKAAVEFNPANHHLEIAEESGIVSGKINIALADLKYDGIPQKVTVTTALTLSRIAVESFSGSIKYDIDDIDIAPVDLKDLPDVLSQEGTNIKIANPQIYLSVTNPFSQYGVHASTGFSLSSLRPNQASVRSSIDNGTFTISSAAQSFYCLSPSRPEKYYEGYASATHVPFTSLSTAFSGNGLPKSIAIDLDPTIVPVQNVDNFTLGSYAGVKGEYVFFCPLALEQGSVIEYTKTEDGWSDDSLDKMTVTNLKVDASLTTNVPFDLEFTGYPVNKRGEQIKGVEIKGAVVNANAKDQQLSIYITGTITDLDGICFSAHAVSAAGNQALSPNQIISAKNIRATVSGYYDDEL